MRLSHPQDDPAKSAKRNGREKVKERKEDKRERENSKTF